MGVNFCGYRIFTTHSLLRLSSKKKIKRNVKKWNKQYLKKDLDMKNTIQSINSWLGHASHCNSHKLQNAVLNKCNFLFNTDYFSKVESELINLIESDINHNL